MNINVRQALAAVIDKVHNQMVSKGHTPGTFKAYEDAGYAVSYCQVCGLHADVTISNGDVIVNGPALYTCTGEDEAYEPPQWTPFVKDEEYVDKFGVDDPNDINELFFNSRYHVCKTTKHTPDGQLVHLSIRDNWRTARHDWRDFQRIKNELVGPEEEAIEIYPAESRLVDGANQFHMWVMIGKMVPVGFVEGRQVSETTDIGNCKQRPWEPDAKPSDLKHFSMDDVAKAKAKMLANANRNS